MNQDISERIKALVGHFSNGNNSIFAAKIGTNEANIRNYINGRQPKYEVLSSIAQKFEINYEWLLTGNGKMLPEGTDNFKHNANQQFPLRSDRAMDVQQIPLYNLEAVAGLVPLFNNIKETEVEDYLSIPRIPKCDGAVFVTGDSMYPLLKSGDIVAYKQIHDIKNEIFWGEMYLISIDISGEEYISVKYIQKSEKGEKYIKLVSENRHHQPKNIQLSKVRALALIKASVRINSMG